MKLDKHLIPVRSIFHKVVNYFLALLIGLFLLLVIFIGFTQTATFRNYARVKVVEILNDSINGRINIESLDGSIFTTLIVRNASLYSQGDTILSVGKVALRISPMRLFVKSIYVKQLEVENVSAKLFADSAGVYNIAKVFPPTEKDTTPTNFTFKIQLEKGKLKNISAMICDEIRRAESADVSSLDMGNLRLQNLNGELKANASIKKNEYDLEIFSLGAQTNIKDFALDNISSKISVSPAGITIEKLDLKTLRSDLKLTASIEGLNIFGTNFSEELHRAQMKLSLNAAPFHFDDLNSMLGFTEYLAGPLVGDIAAVGSLDDLDVKKLFLQLGESKLDVTGRLRKILDGSTMKIDAAISKSMLHRKDVLTLLPTITIPEFENYSSLQIDSLEYSGTPLAFATKVKLGANSGIIRGGVSFDFTGDDSKYDLDLTATDLNLTPFVKHPCTFNGGVKVKGINFLPATLSTAFSINGAYSIIGRQIYNKMLVDGEFKDGALDMQMMMKTDADSIFGDLNAVFFPDTIPSYDISLTGRKLNLADVFMDSTLTSNINFTLSVAGKGLAPDDIMGEMFVRFDKGYIGSNDLENVEARLSLSHKLDGSRFINLKSDLIDAEVTGNYRLSALAATLQNEITNINETITDKFAGYFPSLKKDIEKFLSKEPVLVKNIDSGYAGDVAAKFIFKIKDLSKISGFIKGKELSFDGNIEGELNSNRKEFNFLLRGDVGFMKYVDPVSSFFVRDAAWKITIAHPFDNYSFSALKHSIALEADQAFVNADIKQLFLSATLDSSKMKLVFRAGYGEDMNIQANGITYFDDDSLVLQLGSIKYKYKLFEVFNKVPATIAYTKEQFSISRLALWRGDGKIALDGTFSLTDSINLNLSAKNLKGYDLSFSLFNTSADEVVDNDLNIDAKITGNMANPRIDLDLVADSITFKKTVYGSYIGNIQYAEKKLAIDLKLVEQKNGKPENRMTLSGFIPIDLSFASVDERVFMDKPVELNLFADRFNIASLGELMPFISNVRGSVNSEISILGTFNNPIRKGYLRLDDGVCLIDINNLEYNASMYVTLENREILIKEMTFSNAGQVKNKGTIKGSGSIDVTDFTDPTVQLRVRGDLSVMSSQRRSAELALYGDAYVESDGEILFTMTHGKSYLRMPLLIKQASLVFPPMQGTYSGVVDNFYYRYPELKPVVSNRQLEIDRLLSLYNERLRQGSQEKNNSYFFDYEISVRMKDETNFVFIFSEEANQKLNAYLNGEIQFERKNGIQNFQGELKVLEGSTLEFIKTFTATGSLRFESDVTNPYLDIVGVYKNYYSENDTARGDTKEEEVAVKVKLKGPVQDLAKSFSKTENNIAVYYGKTNIEKGIVSTEYDNVDAIWFVIMGKFKKDLTTQDKTKAAAQVDPITGTATSVASSLIGNLLNAYLGDVVRSVEVRNSGTATKFNLSGKYGAFKYTFGGSTNFLQDLSAANVRVEYSLIDNLIIRVERREAINNNNSTNEMINELGLRYSFEF